MKPLSIVLPYYNPPKCWEQHVNEAYKQLREVLGFDPEVIVVNDGSTIAQDKALIFLQQNIPDFKPVGYMENRGKGAALRYGVRQAIGEKCIFTDIDMPYTHHSFVSIWDMLKTHDIAVGIKDKDYYSHLPKSRIRISRLLRKMIGFFFRMPITDTQCGLKGFNQKGRDVFLNTTIDRYLCDLEFIYRAYRIKPPLKIMAQEVSLRAAVTFRKMDAKILFSEFFNFIKILKD